MAKKRAAARKSGSARKSVATKKKGKKVGEPAFTKAEVKRIGAVVEAELGSAMADRVITVLSDPGVTQVPNP